MKQLTEDYFQKYADSSYDSMTEKQPIKKVGKRLTETDISLKKTYRWLTKT